jgi:hypothetical protein
MDTHFYLTLNDATYTVDWLKVGYLAVIFFLIIRLRKSAKKNKTLTAHMKTVQAPAEETPMFTMLGNENYTITGLHYEDKRIPDIEVKSRALFLDGNFKRNLARNSRLYNRGPGVFVDGKFVG